MTTDNRATSARTTRTGVAPTARRLFAGVAALLVVVGLGTAATAAPGSTDRSAAATADTDYGRMLLVLDSSGSMKEKAAGGTTKIAAAKAALGSVIGDLPDDADVGLRVFGAKVFSRTQKGACTDSQLVVKPGTDNRAALRKAVAAYQPYGETPIAYALRQAAKDIGSEGKRSIVLVSDGEATCRPDPCVVARELAAQGIDLQIDVVGLSVTGKARQQLQCIAEKGNGTYYDVDSAEEITQSLTRVATRAVRPFTVTGRAIDGSTDKARPTPITQGDWSDKLGPKGATNGTRYYLYDRKTTGTTLRVSVVTPGDIGEWDGVEIDATPLDDPTDNTVQCANGIDYRTVGTTAVLGAEVIADGKDSRCGLKGRYLLTVSRWLSAPAQVPIAIRVSEEPVVTDTGEAPSEPEPKATLPQVGGSAKHVLGGSSFSDATKVGTGRYDGTIVPGEAQMFRVPLKVGQHALVRLHTPAASEALRKEVGYIGPFATMRLYNPMHGALADATDAQTSAALIDGKPVDLVDATPVVNRADQLMRGRDASLPGDYFVGLSVQRKDTTVEIPYTLSVQVVDDDGTPPTYAGGKAWSVAGTLDQVAEKVKASRSEGETSSSTDRSSGSSAASDDPGLSTPVKLAAAGGLGVVAVGCLVGALLLLRRPRT